MAEIVSKTTQQPTLRKRGLLLATWAFEEVAVKQETKKQGHRHGSFGWFETPGRSEMSSCVPREDVYYVGENFLSLLSPTRNIQAEEPSNMDLVREGGGRCAHLANRNYRGWSKQDLRRMHCPRPYDTKQDAIVWCCVIFSSCCDLKPLRSPSITFRFVLMLPYSILVSLGARGYLALCSQIYM